MAPSSAVQQTVQYLLYVSCSVFLSSGFICIRLSKKAEIDEELIESIKRLDENVKSIYLFSKNYEKKLEEERLKESQTPPEKIEPRSYESILDDPSIKDKAELLNKLYGEGARRRFIESQKKELGL
jgi:hypothetical protein